jgi:hypothetical protein
MSRRGSSILCLWFLAAPLAARQPAPSPFRPGGVSLELSDSAFSALSVSVPALGADLCKATSAFPPKIEGKTKCHPPKLGNPQLGDALILEIVETRPSGDGGTILVRLFPRSLKLAGPQPFNTACGSWRYWLSLDPRATQRITKVVLRPDAGDSLAGDLHGVLPMATVLHFEGVDSARRIDVPLTLRLDLKGRWAGVPLPLADGVLDPVASNLVLFADSSRESWAGRRECVNLRPFVGEVCLSAPPSPSSLKSLNANP